MLIPSFNTLDLKLVWNYEIYNALATPRLTKHVLYSCFSRDVNGHTHIHWARVCTQRPRTYGKVILSSFCEGTSALNMAAVETLPPSISKLGQDVKLFGKWDTQEYVLSCLFCHFLWLDVYECWCFLNLPVSSLCYLLLKTKSILLFRLSPTVWSTNNFDWTSSYVA